ncbi:hypothetical protein ACU635_42690 [[Actinomadura] parvosata]|uniref:hypothetical protein n=1 Tax=[Actinomadura] parvosata TaxID=1955412 RepID=UPI00406C0807
MGAVERRRFEELYTEHYGAVSAYVHRRTDHPDDTADVYAWLAPPRRPRTAAPPYRSRSHPVTAGVTLISGDRVEVSRYGHRVIPGSGREVTFTQQVRGGHL